MLPMPLSSTSLNQTVSTDDECGNDKWGARPSRFEDENAITPLCHGIAVLLVGGDRIGGACATGHQGVATYKIKVEFAGIRPGKPLQVKCSLACNHDMVWFNCKERVADVPCGEWA
jgi:hypothetical protein